MAEKVQNEVLSFRGDWRALPADGWGNLHVRFDPRHRVRGLFRQGTHGDAHEAILDAFAGRVAEAGFVRDGPELSWDQLRVRGFWRFPLYDRCCKRFHPGSMDPRMKTDAFLDLYGNMLNWLEG
eukprot:UN0201